MEFCTVRDTRAIILEARKKFPKKTYLELGHLAGVTKQRVHQILKAAGFGFVHPVYNCINCNKILKSKNKSRMCLPCFNTTRGHGYVDLVCMACQTLFQRRVAQVYRNRTNKHSFCSRKCMGRILGLYFGNGLTKQWLSFDDAINYHSKL